MAGDVPPVSRDSGWDAQRTSFGATASAYDAHRPDWPAATAAWLCGDPDGPLDVLDVAAGTGKLTRSLVEAGHRVTAVDTSEGMLAVLSRTLPGVRTVVAPAEDLPLADARFDAVTVAQAWHWLDHDRAAAEFARVLRPGGVLGIGWHVRATGSHAWLRELESLVHGHRERRDGRAAADSTTIDEHAVRLPPAFGPVETTTLGYAMRTDPAGLAALATTWSYVAMRPDRDDVLVQVEELGRRVAAADGAVTVPHVTYCYRARLPDPAA